MRSSSSRSSRSSRNAGTAAVASVAAAVVVERQQTRLLNLAVSSQRCWLHSKQRTFLLVSHMLALWRHPQLLKRSTWCACARVWKPKAFVCSLLVLAKFLSSSAREVISAINVQFVTAKFVLRNQNFYRVQTPPLSQVLSSDKISCSLVNLRCFKLNTFSLAQVLLHESPCSGLSSSTSSTRTWLNRNSL